MQQSNPVYETIAEIRTDRVWAALVDGPVDPTHADAFVRSDHAGAVVLFLGTTRRFTASRETTNLEYEAYNEMAVSTLAQIAESALQRWPVCQVAVIHATGDVPMKQASVCVAVSTPHRADAFEAGRYVIDALKEEATIWKKERYADGSAAWVAPDGVHPDDVAPNAPNVVDRNDDN